MLDLFTLLGAVGVESEVLKARETVTGQARGNIFNQAEIGQTVNSSEESNSSSSSIHQIVLNLLSILPDTPSLDLPKPAKSA